MYLRHTHLAVQPSEWEEPSACLMESGWSFLPSERGRVRTGAGRKRFPLSLENCPRCSAVSEPMPPNQTVLMTHDPGTWALGAHLCHFKTPQTHHYTVHLFASHSHTYGTLSEPEVLTCLAPSIRAMFWVISMFWEMAVGIFMCF